MHYWLIFVFELSVWLNERAEKRKAQEWDNEHSKKLERIHEEIRNRLSQCYNTESSNAANKRNITDVSNITCPQELFEIMESSNDPETLEVRAHHRPFHKTNFYEFFKIILH